VITAPPPNLPTKTNRTVAETNRSVRNYDTRFLVLCTFHDFSKGWSPRALFSTQMREMKRTWAFLSPFFTRSRYPRFLRRYTCCRENGAFSLFIYILPDALSGVNRVEAFPEYLFPCGRVYRGDERLVPFLLTSIPAAHETPPADPAQIARNNSTNIRGQEELVYVGEVIFVPALLKNAMV